jgi:hypothetical protein
MPQKYRWWVIALLLTSPAAFFLHMFYAEALFCAVVFWAYLLPCVGGGRHMGILLAISTAARLPAVLFVGLCMLEYWRALGWRIRAACNPNALWLLLAPLGFVAYGLFLYWFGATFWRCSTAHTMTK